MIVSPSTIEGTLPTPPSRWHTQICLALASLATGESRLEHCAIDDVTIALMGGLEAMGADFTVNGDMCTVQGGLFHSRGDVNAEVYEDNLAILASVASNLPRNSRIRFERLTGNPYPFLNSLLALGVIVSSRNQGRESPWLLRGPPRGRQTHISGEVPPAFVCSLPLTSILRGWESEITIYDKDLSQPYMAVTSDAMSRFGLRVSCSHGHIRIMGNTDLRPATVRVIDDRELSCYPLVAGCLCGRVTMKGDAEREAIQPLHSLHAKIKIGDGKITASRSEIDGGDIDLSSCPRAFPAIAVLATRARGGTRLHSANIPGKDLIAPTVRMLRQMGCLAKETIDGAIIPYSHLHGAELGTIQEPLVAAAALIAAASADGESSIDNPEICENEYPGFLRQMRLLGLSIE